MRRLLCLGAAAALLAVLAFNAPATDAAGKTFLYVHDNDEADNEVHAFQFGSDGTLVELPGSPFDTGVAGSGCGGMCQTAAFTKKGRFLFVGSAEGIVVFSAAKDGTLTLVPGSPFGGVPVDGLTVVQRKKKLFAYGSDFNGNQVLGFNVNADGSLTPLAGSPFPAGNGPDGMSTANTSLFVANENDSTISAYRINNDGSLTAAPGSPFSVDPADIYNVNVTPDGRFVYAADGDDSQIVGFVVNPITAALTPLPGSPFAAGVATDVGLAVGKGDVLIAPGDNTGSPNLQAFRYPKTTGVLTPLGEAQSAGNTLALDGATIDPKGRYLIVSASRDDFLRVFEINRTNGTLTEVETENVVLGDNDVNGLAFSK